MPEAGEESTPHWFRTRPTSLLAALYPHSPGARLSLCPLQALRGTSGGATMTIPGGAGTYPMRKRSFLRARRTGFYHRVGVPHNPHRRGLRPSLCPHPNAARLACANLRRMGDRQSTDPPSPSVLVWKHTSSVKKSPIWARKKWPFWGRRLGPPR
jgi:hypothetical protein